MVQRQVIPRTSWPGTIRRRAGETRATQTGRRRVAKESAMAADRPVPDTRLHAEDLLRIAVLDDVALSPDGLSAAVTIRTSDTAANRYRSSIVIYPLDDSPPWSLTAGQARDWAPRWSPDGRHLAFLSNRDGSAQVWLIGLHG